MCGSDEGDVEWRHSHANGQHTKCWKINEHSEGTLHTCLRLKFLQVDNSLGLVFRERLWPHPYMKNWETINENRSQHNGN